MKVGVKVDGRRVRLKSKRVGGRIVTTREWLAEFEEECNRDRREPVTSTRRSGGLSAVDRLLAAEGFYGCETTTGKVPREHLRP
jgi:hypothetical protein